MIDRSLERLLGNQDPDPGCDGAFEVMDEYVEAVRRGLAPGTGCAGFITHLRNCAACREDTEGLLMALDLLGLQPPGQ